MKEPLVSVLTTIYNRDKYIFECIESVLASSFQDWEMIIVDDCSTDDSVAISREFEKKDKRIRVYVNETNLGDYLNRNRAASYATGKYLKYLDADDIIYKYSLQIMVDSLEQFHEADLALSYNVINPVKPYPQQVSSNDALLSFFLGKSVLGVGPSAAIFRRSVFKKLGGFKGEQYIGDTDMWVRLALQAPVVILPPSLVYWRQHEGQQIVSERKNFNLLKKRYQFKIELLKSIKGRLSDDEFYEAFRFTDYRYARMIWNYLIIQGQPCVALKLIRNSKISLFKVIRAILPYNKIKPNPHLFDS